MTSPEVAKESVLKIQGAADRNNVAERGSNLNFFENKSFQVI